MTRAEVSVARKGVEPRAIGILGVISLMWMLTIGARITYPAVMPGIQTEFEIGYSTIGLLVGGIWAAYGVMQLPGGLLVDKSSGRMAILAGMVVTIAGLLGVIFGERFGVFVVATVVLGGGTGLLGPSRVLVLHDTFPSRKTTAVSISQMAGTLGNMLLPIGAGVVMGYLGWRAGIGILLPLLVIVTVLIWFMIPTRQRSTHQIPLFETIRVAIGQTMHGPALFGTVLMLGIMMSFQSVSGFLPTYLVDEAGVSASSATVLFGLFFGTGLVMQLIAGIIGDRLGPTVAVGACAAIAIPGLGILLWAGSIWTVGLGVMLASSILGCFPPGLSYLASVFPSSVQGSGFGVARTIYITGGAGGPVAMGAIADAYSLLIGFIALIGVMAGVAILAGSSSSSDISFGSTQPRSVR